jgi:hypothetical protein
MVCSEIWLLPRYYFHIVIMDRIIEDFEGTDLSDLEVARGEAIEDARVIMSQAILKGRDVSGRTMHIADGDGTVLLKVPFAAAISPET